MDISKSASEILEEFNIIKTIKLDKNRCTIGNSQTNRKYNRYSDIVPYDDYLVANDYVNASYICGDKWIATDSPNHHAVQNFWKMVWDKYVSIIVTLTKFEPGKAEKYFSVSELKRVMNIEDLSITFIDNYCNENFVITTLFLECNGITRYLKHIQLLTWPDKNVISKELLYELCTVVHNMHNKFLVEFKNRCHKILVHCSAGIGRTGTFIASYMSIFEKTEESIFNIVKDMRNCRGLMVQTEAQYELIFQVKKYSLVKSISNLNSQIYDFNKSKKSYDPFASIIDDDWEYNYLILDDMPVVNIFNSNLNNAGSYPINSRNRKSYSSSSIFYAT